MTDCHWNARVIKVIVTELEQRGDGTTADPYRRVRQYWSLDGKLLAEVDHFKLRRDRDSEAAQDQGISPRPP